MPLEFMDDVEDMAEEKLARPDEGFA